MPRRFAVLVAALVPFGCGLRVAECASSDPPARVPPVAPVPPLPNEKGAKPEVVPPKTDPSIELLEVPRLEDLEEKTYPIAVPLTGEADPNGPPPSAFLGRSGAAKAKLVSEGGGNKETEQAVARGLVWLAKQQKDDGGWEYDANRREHRIAATGMALLPFLAAGETHKLSKDRREPSYQKAVLTGLSYLMKHRVPTGPNAGRMSGNAYEQAIATLALCEAYGMTKDPVLKPYAQTAVNFIQKSQGRNGSWGYTPGTEGDTSIVGWQVQALAAAKLSKGLVVDDRVVKKAVQFLDLASAGKRKAMYGYGDSTDARAGTGLTASGLLSRYYLDGWGPNHPGMCDGVAGLMEHPPPDKGGVKELYYYYYATQVVRFSDGEDWKTWNEGSKQEDGTRKGGTRDWLVKAQARKDGPDHGSWDPDTGFFGTHCGRLGTTAMCVLTLEVYYRQPQLYKNSGADIGPTKTFDK